MKIQINRNVRGFSLIEVMIAVIVLAVGLLSLAALQGELFRAGAEAKARANAATIAQQVVEDARSFSFLSAPDEDYELGTYGSLDSEDWEVTDVSGVDFTVDREVVRYRWNAAAGEFEINDADAYAVGVPEFKLVRVSVSGTDSNGNDKSVEMTDSIAAIAPADVTKVMQGPTEASRGPEFWIVPPNKNNPRVVPIAVGDDKSSASSNPTPEQFIEDASAVTRFSVLSFTGSTAADEVQLTRRLDIAAASCVCGTAEGVESTADNPAYNPSVWNGITLQYEEPTPVPAGTPVGIADVGNDSEIEPICTVCCRDHLAHANRSPTPDPYRTAVGDDDSVDARYTYEPKGGGFVFGDLIPTEKADGLYLDSCHLTRVNGRMRVTIDAQQASLVTTALNTLGSGYLDADFVTRYSGYVTGHLEEALGKEEANELPEGYPSPDSRFPAPSTTHEELFADIVSPDAISFAEGNVVDLVSFGLYIDYLSDDTLLAYRCAAEEDDEDECLGLGKRDPLSVLPFYAVNVASLGAWAAPSGQTVASVADATYKQGQLLTPGGAVTAGKGASILDEDDEPIPTPITISINNSNTGLAGTLPFDPDDALDTNTVVDSQGFVKGEGVPEPSTNQIALTVHSGPLNFKTMGISFGLGCSKKNDDATCGFESPLSSGTMTFSNYNDETKGKDPVVIDRMICLPSHAKIFSTTVANPGALGETTVVTFVNLGAVDYSLLVSVQAQSGTCDLTGLSMTP